jgi:hypothetical protein
MFEFYTFGPIFLAMPVFYLWLNVEHRSRAPEAEERVWQKQFSATTVNTSTIAPQIQKLRSIILWSYSLGAGVVFTGLD